MSRIVRTALVVATALALSGCFDLTQRLTIDRGGGGHYETAITASGLLGEALKDKKQPLSLGRNRTRARIAVGQNGKVTQSAIIDFKSLSTLRFSDESLSLTNHGASWFGIGPSHLTFRRTFLVDRARRENMRGRPNEDNDKLGGEMLQTMFGDHAYVFSVTVPGWVERAAPIRMGKTTFAAQVSGSGLSRTVTWRMPLYTLLQAKLVKFEVDFSAYGSFADAQSSPE